MRRSKTAFISRDSQNHCYKVPSTRPLKHFKPDQNISYRLLSQKNSPSKPVLSDLENNFLQINQPQCMSRVQQMKFKENCADFKENRVSSGQIHVSFQQKDQEDCLDSVPKYSLQNIIQNYQPIQIRKFSQYFHKEPNETQNIHSFQDFQKQLRKDVIGNENFGD